MIGTFLTSRSMYNIATPTQGTVLCSIQRNCTNNAHSVGGAGQVTSFAEGRFTNPANLSCIGAASGQFNCYTQDNTVGVLPVYAVVA